MLWWQGDESNGIRRRDAREAEYRAGSIAQSSVRLGQVYLGSETTFDGTCPLPRMFLSHAFVCQGYAHTEILKRIVFLVEE